MKLEYEAVRLRQMEKDITRMMDEITVMNSFLHKASPVGNKVIDASVSALKSKTSVVMSALTKLNITLSYVSLIISRGKS